MLPIGVSIAYNRAIDKVFLESDETMVTAV